MAPFALEWRDPKTEAPPDFRIVLLVISHREEPEVMRKHALGSQNGGEWRINDAPADFAAWGWYIIAWADLPPVSEPAHVISGGA